MLFTFGEFTIDQVYELINETQRITPRGVSLREVDMHVECGGKWFVVRAGSQRYDLFKNHCQCVRCGVEGVKFLLQAHAHRPGLLQRQWFDKDGIISYPKPVFRAHFNLFGERNGGLVMLTKDHIKPVCQGGRSIANNYQTMCAHCNHKKGGQHQDFRNGERSKRKTLKKDFVHSPTQPGKYPDGSAGLGGCANVIVGTTHR
jgi:hypothetical protein